MTTPSLTDVALNAGARIGRYFSLVSLLPALFLAAWSVVLVASGAWSGEPDPKKLADALTTVSFSGYAWILLATVTFALFLHPLQLGMTRLLEGYWGSSRVATVLLRVRITHYRKKRARLNARRKRLDRQRERVLRKILVRNYRTGLATDPDTVKDPATMEDSEFRKELLKLLPDKRAHAASGAHAALESIPHQLERYPASRRMMPTRLGNALRSAEDRIGTQYGLDAIRAAPHIALVAPELHLSYLQDTRQQMDTSIRLCVVALLATVESAAALLTDRWWLLATIAPYLLAWIAYRAAVAAADQYMATVGTVLDLNRFRLYESLHVKLPWDTEEERDNNLKLMHLIAGSDVNLRYEHPGADTGSTAPTPPRTP
ncbi:hypothetical protein SAMN04489727_2990 [Amycolatopsis tolypomycina]|uniref:Uncharacterized protein n=1 Tax=Amycolatopsis tolypomycina TaxID=208445 RepID=A0A1H4QQF5_9PSEU|nr:hypothetical protein [Amycolatopsis tolypomycina]SEC21883.1 hypothetical protein SAMN04489727_2990 [Amycolatopsis tolypomycina]